MFKSIEKNEKSLENIITIQNKEEIYQKTLDEWKKNKKRKTKIEEEKLDDKLKKILHIASLKEIIDICNKKRQISIEKTGVLEYDTYHLASIYSTIFLSNLIVIEYNLPDDTKNRIIKYYNAENVEEEVLKRMLIELLEEIIRFYNMLNFPQVDYSGIGLRTIDLYDGFYNTLLSPYYYVIKDSKYNWDDLFYNSLKTPYYIDNYIGNNKERIEHFLFLIEGFMVNAHSSRLVCINYIAALEFLLTHKPKEGLKKFFNLKNDSIIYQLRKKVKMCYDGSKINEQELDKIIRFNYNYRSDILHGNFRELEKDIRKISNLRYVKETLNLYKKEKIDVYETTNNNILDINSDLLKDLFKNIFIHLSNNPDMIEKIKKE